MDEENVAYQKRRTWLGGTAVFRIASKVVENFSVENPMAHSVVCACKNNFEHINSYLISVHKMFFKVLSCSIETAQCTVRSCAADCSDT